MGSAPRTLAGGGSSATKEYRHAYERLFEFCFVRRTTGKFSSEFAQIQTVSLGKSVFADLVLLAVVMATETDDPLVRRFERHSAISTATDMRTFDGKTEATFDAAVMAPDPRPVRWACPCYDVAPCALYRGW